MLTKEETLKWNIEGNHNIDKALLNHDQQYDHYYRVLFDQFNMYYAFDNGCLISLEGTKSYRAAIRHHIITKLTLAFKSNQKCAVVKTDAPDQTPYVENINKISLDRLIYRYMYQKLIDKYGDTDYTWELHDIIDEWNQIPFTCNDLTRVNPKRIYLSPQHQLVFQKMYLKPNDPEYEINPTPIFYNGVPLTYLEKIERIFKDGLVIGELNHGSSISLDKETQLNFVAEAIISALADEKYNLLSDDTKEFQAEVEKAKALILKK